MGYEAKLDFVDHAGARWIGAHRPELTDLARLFVHLAELDEEKVNQGGLVALEAWKAVLPQDVLLVRLMSARCLHLHLPNGASIQDVVVKLVPARQPTGFRRLTGVVERSRSHRSHMWAHRLRALGIETPRPLGYVEHERAPSRHLSFAAFEHVGAPTLTEIRDNQLNLMPLGLEGLAEKRALVRRLAVLIRTMHQQDVFHGDLHPGNILVTKEGLLVVDLESIRTTSWPGRATMKNLVRLNRDFRDTTMITRTDRMRFLKTYLQHEANQRDRIRGLWHRVLGATQRKLSERGEVFSGAV